MQWEFERLGHSSLGDRVLVLSAFARAQHSVSPREMHCERGRKAMNPPDGYRYSSKELAELLHVDASTIRRWRTSNPPQGPAFV